MNKTLAGQRYRVVDFADIPGVPCPCGVARRAFTDVPELPATVHITEISENAALHYHKILTVFVLAPNAVPMRRCNSMKTSSR